MLIDQTDSTQVDLDVIEATTNKDLDEEQGGTTGYTNLMDDLQDVANVALVKPTEAFNMEENSRSVRDHKAILQPYQASQAVTRSPGGLSSRTITTSWPSWRRFAINFLHEPGVSKNLSTGYIRPMMFHGLSSPSLPQEHWTILLQIKTNDNVSRIPSPRQPTATANTINAVIFWITFSQQQQQPVNINLTDYIAAIIKNEGDVEDGKLDTKNNNIDYNLRALKINKILVQTATVKLPPLPPLASESSTGSDLAPAWPYLSSQTSSTILEVASPQPYLASTSQNRPSGGPKWCSTLRAMTSSTIMVVASPQPYLASTSQNKPSGGPTLRAQAMSSLTIMVVESPQPYLAPTSQASSGPAWGTITSSLSNWIRIPWVAKEPSALTKITEGDSPEDSMTLPL